MMSLVTKKVAPRLGLLMLAAGIALATSTSEAGPSRSQPTRVPQITEVWTPRCGMVPVFAGPNPALIPDPSAGQRDPAAFDRLSGLPMGGGWCFN